MKIPTNNDLKELVIEHMLKMMDDKRPVDLTNPWSSHLIDHACVIVMGNMMQNVGSTTTPNRVINSSNVDHMWGQFNFMAYESARVIAKQLMPIFLLGKS